MRIVMKSFIVLIGMFILCATGAIAQQTLHVTAAADSKVYDANNVATVTLGDDRNPGDNITITFTSATFNDATAGVGKTVTVDGLAIGGPDAGNYQLASTSVTTSADITPRPLTITTNNAARQYSDPNPAFPPTYDGFAAGENASNLTGTTVCSSTAPTLGTPGTYSITCSGATSNNYDIHYASATLTIVAEDARVAYIGLLSTATASPTTSTGTLTLVANVRDITNFPLDPQYDATPGVISTARVTFRDVVRGTTLCSANVGLNGTDQTSGTATCNATVNIGAASSANYTIGLIVGGYYTRNNSADNIIVTVSKPVSHSITGSGTITLSASGGVKAGDVGATGTFTFAAQYSGSTTTGNFDLVYKRTESSVLRTYEIKSSSVAMLLAGGGKASFNVATFGTVLDVTNPLSPVTIDGNATIAVTFTDNGSSGDTIGVAAFNKLGGTWFSSKFNGTSTTEQTLTTGNCVVN